MIQVFETERLLDTKLQKHIMSYFNEDDYVDPKQELIGIQMLL